MRKCIVIVSLLCVLTACSLSERRATHGTAVDHIAAALDDGAKENKRLDSADKSLPGNVAAALFASGKTKADSSENADVEASSEPHYDIAVQEMPAQVFFNSLVEGTPYSVVVSSRVRGNVTLNLSNVSVPQALEIVRDTYGYEYTQTAYGYHITSPVLATKVFTLNYLNIKRVGSSSLSVTATKITGGSSSSSDTSTDSSSSDTSSDESSTGSSDGGSSVTTSTESDIWTEITTTISAMVGTTEGRSVVTSPDTGTLVVRAYPAELRRVSDYLDHIQGVLNRQVILEAKILEVELKDGFQSGIDWTLLGAAQTGDTTAPGTNLGDFTQILRIGIGGQGTSGDFKAAIDLLSTQGNVQVLSSPRVSTLNNQKAVIKVGDDEFFVTDVSSSTESTDTSTATEDVSLSPFFSGITLDVTPQISKRGWVTLHIHPSVSVITEQVKTVELSESRKLNLPLAKSNLRESDTLVRARTGQVVVIGGLMQNRTEEEIAAVPGFGKLPFLGSFFRHTEQTSKKSELVILLRTMVVGGNTWEDQLKETARRVKTLNRGFHFGDKPAVFGNQGEFKHAHLRS